MMTRLDVKAFGFMLGCVWGVAVFILGMMAMVSTRWAGIIKLFSRVYIGYKATVLGSFTGAVWGFVDGAVSGVVIAWIYNKIAV